MLARAGIDYRVRQDLVCITANDDVMKCEGEATIKVKSDDGKTAVIDALVSSECKDEMLVSWHDLVALSVLPKDFPRALDVQGAARVRKSTTEAGMEALKREYSDVLSDKLKPEPIKCPPMKIRLKSNAVPKKILHTRQVALHLKEAADDELRELLEAKVLAPAHNITSEWCSPGFFVPKPDQKRARLVTDFTYLNSQVERPEHPFPSAMDILRSIPATARVFLKLDCKSGYHQLGLDEDSRHLTVFMLPQGRFLYLRACMGLAPSSDEWNIHSDKIIEGCEWARKIVDDILLWAHDYEELWARAKLILERCRELGVTISLKKLEYGSEIVFAGYTVSAQGIRPDPAKTECIRSFPEPKDVSGLRSFLGLVNQLSFFMPDLIQQLQQCRALLKANVVWKWEPEHQAEFDEVKRILSTTELLVKPFDPTLKTVLLTDAAKVYGGLGFALMQKEPITPEKEKGGHRLVCCGSKALTETQQRYAIIELECYGIVWAIKHCSFYLLGCQHFEVHTDHRPLQGVFKQGLQEVASPRCRALREKVAAFNFTVKYVQGKSHFIADHLSRNPLWGAEEDGTEHELTTICFAMRQEVAISQLDVAAGDDEEYMAVREAIASGVTARRLPKDHPGRAYKKVWDSLAIFSEDSNLLVLNGRRICIPRQARPALLARMHLAHGGLVKTKALARQLYYWPTVNNDIANMVGACEQCRAHLPSLPKLPSRAFSAPICPMSHLGADLFQCGGNHFLVLVDRYSGMPFVWPLRGLSTAEVTHHMTECFDFCGWPAAIRTDGGPQFRQEFENFCKEMGIQHELSSAYNPNSNGLSEAAVKNVKYLMEKCLATGQSMSAALLEWRNMPRADGYSPAEMFWGRRQRTRLPTLPIHHEVIDHSKAEAARKKTAEEHAEYFDRTTRDQERLQPGQRVVLQDPKTKRWTLEGEVISERPHGGSYLVETDAGRTTVRNRSHIRPEVGTEECASADIPAAPLTPDKRRSARLQGKTVDYSAQLSTLQAVSVANDWPLLPAPSASRGLSWCTPSSPAAAATTTTCPSSETTFTSSETRTACSRTRAEDCTSSSSIWARSDTPPDSWW